MHFAQEWQRREESGESDRAVSLKEASWGMPLPPPPPPPPTPHLSLRVHSPQRQWDSLVNQQGLWGNLHSFCTTHSQRHKKQQPLFAQERRCIAIPGRIEVKPAKGHTPQNRNCFLPVAEALGSLSRRPSFGACGSVCFCSSSRCTL